jgi:hypothetical protein
MLSVYYPTRTQGSDFTVSCPILSDDDDDDDDDGNSDEEGKAAHPLMLSIQNVEGDGEVQHNMPTQVSRARTTSGTYD